MGEAVDNKPRVWVQKIGRGYSVFVGVEYRTAELYAKDLSKAEAEATRRYLNHRIDTLGPAGGWPFKGE